MSDVLYFLLIGILFYAMMRWGCGAHMMGGSHGDHSGHSGGKPGEIKERPVDDPVCGMKLEAVTAGFAEHYRGGLYYFCSVQCQEKFRKNPESYMKAM
jgi:YHS domain-containing protein